MAAAGEKPMAVDTRGDLPRGKTLFDASPAAIGKRLILAFNSMIEAYEWDRIGFLLYVREEERGLTRYFYFEIPAEALDPASFTWKESDRQKADNWARNLRADLKGEKRGASGSDRAALTWTSGGSVLTRRFEIPEDADTWTVHDSQVLSREETTQAILAAINQRA